MWVNNGEINTYSNDPNDFRMPFEVFSDFEKEIYEYNYYRLTNRPKNPWSVRCNSFIYGQYEIQKHVY